MKRQLVVLISVLTLGFGAMTPGCSPRTLGFVAGMVVLGTAMAILAEHDAHFHSHHCGHRHVIYEGRDVYYYNDHWEYYDPNARRWYFYRD
ncbi:MAG: hypothetical protein KC609_01780 [Myxococcales bacterium]|nr:hypothetical protein [Myxococcales bacterium]